MEVEESEQFSRAVVARLRQARLDLGWSQAKLAETAKVSRTGVTMVENGDRRPTMMFCHALAKALGKNLSDFVVDAESDDPAG